MATNTGCARVYAHQAGTRAGTQTHVCAICSIHNAHSNVSMFGLSDALCESGRGGVGRGGYEQGGGREEWGGEEREGVGKGRDEREGGREGREDMRGGGGGVLCSCVHCQMLSCPLLCKRVHL